ncbi:MAG: phosphoglycerate mutase [Ramlibacter sp.]|jgi:hypothetical protein|nr:phosphoglycerate mutase [Ramlibacter sp.]
MSDSTHLLIPFAACSADGCREALRTLALPHLEKLLARLTATLADTGTDDTLTPPHERALARAYGLDAPDGGLPWAAWQARESGRDTAHGAGGQAWAWITPCHWRMGRDHILMLHPLALQLDAQDARTLVDAMQPYFAQDGITLEYDAPTQWLARGEAFRGLATASLDRVIGRDVNAWMARGGAARTLRRLQSEMQMLLYTHPVNEARERGGLLPVNSFWVSGTGALPPATGALPAGLRVPHYLRDAALRADWAAWADAWRLLDTGECARLLGELDAGRTVRLTLCGERSAQTFESLPKSLFRQLSSRLARTPLSTWLDPL